MVAVGISRQAPSAATQTPCEKRDGAPCKSFVHKWARTVMAVICQLAFRMKVATSRLVSAMLFLGAFLLLALDEFLHFRKLVCVQLIAFYQTHEKGFDRSIKHTVKHVAGGL